MRRVLLTVAAAWAVGLAALPPAALAEPGNVERPNVVLIVTDDQPLGRMDAMPQVKALLADRGGDFTQAMVPTPACCPSRTSLLTGRYSHETGVWRNIAPHGAWSTFATSGYEQHTLAVWLQDAGYRTALIGKYLNLFGRSPEGYVPPGWDTFVAPVGGGNYYDYTLRQAVDGAVGERAYGSAPPDYLTDVLADQAVRTIRSTPDDEPLFLMFTPTAPHAPYLPAPRHAGTWTGPVQLSPDVNEPDMSDKPRWIRELPRVDVDKVRAAVVGQLESLMAVDEAVARIVAALGDRAENTLFVFTSDNGLMLGSHRLLGKSVPHSKSGRVPLVLRWDGRLAPGTVDPRIALNLDVTQTVVEATGLAQQTSGVSLVGPAARRGALVEGIRPKDRTRPGYCGWRTERWLFVEYSRGRGRELYDYASDPFELHNLAHRPAYRETVAKLRARAMAACQPTSPGFRW